MESGSPQLTVWHMSVTCWINNNTNSEYIILIILLLQQREHDGASFLFSIRSVHLRLSVITIPGVWLKLVEI